MTEKSEAKRRLDLKRACEWIWVNGRLAFPCDKAGWMDYGLPDKPAKFLSAVRGDRVGLERRNA